MNDRLQPPGVRLRRLATAELGPAETGAIRQLMDVAFGSDEEERFTEDDWVHAVGGTHYVLDVDGRIVTHAALVERELHVGGRPVRTGYVEAVATAPDAQGAGHGSRVMSAVAADIANGFELGALGTGRHRFYERLGWERWVGPSFVRTPQGDAPTPEDDGYILVLRTPSSPPIDLTATISCEWRPGDSW